MTYYYTYKITCLKGSLKDHYYFGQRTCHKFPDSYNGSGAIIRKYYKKYGAIEGETYTKEIISFYNNLDELNQAEYKLIGDKYENDPMCLNLRAGGDMHGISTYTKIKISNSFKINGHPMEGKHHTKEAKKKMSEKAIGRPSGWKGKHFNEEQRKVLSEKALRRSKRKWITNGTDEFLINVDQIDNYLKEGYKLGRILSIWGVNKTKKPDSEETKFKKGSSSRNHKWMNNGEIQKQIPLEEVQTYLNNGWTFGYVKHKNITD